MLADDTLLPKILAILDGQWPWMILVLGLGTLVQGSVGYGFALLSAPLLMLMEPRLLPGPLLVVGLLLNIAMSSTGKKVVESRPILWLMAGFLPGLGAGSWLLSWLPPRETAQLFGWLVLAGVGISLIRNTVNDSPGALLGAGFLSALMNLTTTMSGPPVALTLQHLPSDRFRATLAWFFAISGVMTLLELLRDGRMGTTELLLGLTLTPAVPLGLLGARWVKRRLDHTWTRVAVLALASLSGIFILLKA
ncbi:MAG: sulfite exporter TauE/SafE family protein [Magnetococcus sp. YQC-9]